MTTTCWIQLRRSQFWKEAIRRNRIANLKLSKYLRNYDTSVVDDAWEVLT